MVKRRSNRRPTIRFIKRSEDRLIKGFAIKGRADPPSVKYVPWWPLTVILNTDSGTKDFNLEVLVTSIRKQVPLLTNFFFKIQSIRLWCFGNACAMDVYELHKHTGTTDATEQNDIIAELLDTAGKMAWSHVGWRYGTLHNSVVHSTSYKNNAHVKIANLSINGSGTMYVQMLIKLEAGTSAVSRKDVVFANDHQSIVDDFDHCTM